MLHLMRNFKPNTRCVQWLTAAVFVWGWGLQAQPPVNHISIENITWETMYPLEKVIEVLQSPAVLTVDCGEFTLKLTAIEGEVDGKCCYTVEIVNNSDEEQTISEYFIFQFENQSGYSGMGEGTYEYLDDTNQPGEAAFASNTYPNPVVLGPKADLLIGTLCLDGTVGEEMVIIFGRKFNGADCVIKVPVPKCEDNCCTRFEIQTGVGNNCPPDNNCFTDVYLLMNGGATDENGNTCADVAYVEIEGRQSQSSITPNTWTEVFKDVEFAAGEVSKTLRIHLKDGRVCEIEIPKPCK